MDNVAIDKLFTDKNLYVLDAEFTSDIKERIAQKIEDGLESVEAANQCGISPKKFYLWRKEDENFRNFIEGQERLRNAKLKEDILKEIGLIKDHYKKQQALLAYLDRIDKEFSMKQVRTESIEGTLTVKPAGLSITVKESLERSSNDNESEPPT